MVKIKSPGGLKRAKKLVDITMERYGIAPKAEYPQENYVALHPYERTKALIDKGLVKILIPDGSSFSDPHYIVKAEALRRAVEARKLKLAEKKRLEEESKQEAENKTPVSAVASESDSK